MSYDFTGILGGGSFGGFVLGGVPEDEPIGQGCVEARELFQPGSDKAEVFQPGAAAQQVGCDECCH